MPPSFPRIAALDGVRGLAILLVLLWHYVVGRLPNELAALRWLGGLAWSGVDLFFVLSGFLLGSILLAQPRTPTTLRNFYTRRVFRLLPLYALWLALFFVLRDVLTDRLTPGAYTWLFRGAVPDWSYLTLTQNMTMAVSGFGTNWLGATWSLAVEAQFCLVLPLLIYVCPPRRLPLVLVGLVALAPLLRYLSVAALSLPLGDYMLLPCRMDALVLGVLCAWALQNSAARTWLERHTRLLRAALVGFALGGVVLLETGVAEPLSSAFGYLWIAGGYSCLLLLVVMGGFARVFTLRPLRQLGGVAYGVYLFHQGISGLVHGVLLGRPPTLEDLPGVALTGIALVITLLAAHLSWRVFEQPLIRWGRRFAAPQAAEATGLLPTR